MIPGDEWTSWAFVLGFALGVIVGVVGVIWFAHQGDE